jgi:hypothetical protein
VRVYSFVVLLQTTVLRAQSLKVGMTSKTLFYLLKAPLPSPEKYADQSYVRQAQKELGL